MKYRVSWRSNLTGVTGNGLYMEKQLADAWLAEGRAKFPSLEHWLEADTILTGPIGPRENRTP